MDKWEDANTSNTMGCAGFAMLVVAIIAGMFLLAFVLKSVKEAPVVPSPAVSSWTK